MGRLSSDASGFPGKRDDPMRAGIIAMMRSVIFDLSESAETGVE